MKYIKFKPPPSFPRPLVKVVLNVAWKINSYKIIVVGIETLTLVL